MLFQKSAKRSLPTALLRNNTFERDTLLVCFSSEKKKKKKLRYYFEGLPITFFSFKRFSLERRSLALVRKEPEGCVFSVSKVFEKVSFTVADRFFGPHGDEERYE